MDQEAWRAGRGVLPAATGSAAARPAGLEHCGARCPGGADLRGPATPSGGHPTRSRWPTTFRRAGTSAGGATSGAERTDSSACPSRPSRVGSIGSAARSSRSSCVGSADPSAPGPIAPGSGEVWS
ncbi:hypothetical protein BN381_80306 [Candidatus Microthrix parvicella RN1]|uniref:Uncharacterized protein n=1 Tax=Candidatus Neomicrothrix parvicella RN1 TaxID=1229780 RepID=R4Z700_9ACTN|nr:hypothetical protein BN381_80306 [Candidatus Microthrix parvicella RN1]